MGLRWQGNTMKYSTNEKCHPDNWQNIRTKKNYQRTRHSSEINRWLDGLQKTAEDVFRIYRNDNKRDPSAKELRWLIEKESFETAAPAGNSFFTFADAFINETKIRVNENTGKKLNRLVASKYQLLINYLKEFERVKKYQVNFDTIDLSFYTKFIGFMNEKHLATNTIGKHISHLKAILNSATERGLNKNLAYKSRKFIALTEESDAIYLTKKEMIALEKLNLRDRPHLELVRDLFLIGCYTGLRHSDYSTLKPQNFRNGFITKETQKQTDQVVIPIHPVVTKLLKKYKGVLPNVYENQPTNRWLKELCNDKKNLPSLQQEEEISITKGGKRITEYFPRYELVTSHTARRSFATNNFLDGVPERIIMAVTGHKTEKAFLKYLKLTSQDKAEMMKKFWAKKKY